MALPFLLRPKSGMELLVDLTAATSTMVVFALERGNADVFLFLLILLASAFYRRAASWRALAYALCLFAGLLKFYPLSLMILPIRETWRRCLAWTSGMGLVVVALSVLYARQLAVLLPNITTVHRSGFWAANLPSGLPEILRLPVPTIAVSGLSWAVLGAAATTVIFGATRRLCATTDDSDWLMRETDCLVIAAVVFVGCFFAGPNIDYRGIFLLMALPGLYRLATRHRELRWLCTSTIASIVFVMWGEFSRQHIGFLFPDSYWVASELVRWWIVSVLGAVILAFVLRSRTAVDLRLNSAMSRLWPDCLRLSSDPQRRP
jgi:hypothetical protein